MVFGFNLFDDITSIYEFRFSVNGLWTIFVYKDGRDFNRCFLLDEKQTILFAVPCYIAYSQLNLLYEYEDFCGVLCRENRHMTNIVQCGVLVSQT